MNADKPSRLVPKRRFPEFAQDPGWDHAKVADLVETVTPLKKLTTSTYLTAGRFPIIDQSQNYICGWTNDDEAVITRPLPVVVFGDHTCVLKFVNQPFAQGADGIKILTAKRRVSTVYLYHQLTYRPVVMEEYKRHFSALKDKVVCFPDPTSAEQQKIADCLGSLDDLIAAEGRKLEALRQHKQGLMQQLFPRVNESQPRLRFPKYRGLPGWESRRISGLLEKVAVPVHVDADTKYEEIGVRSHGKGIFHKAPALGSRIGDKRVFEVIENALVFNIVFAWERAVATTSRAEAGMIASHRFPMYLSKSGNVDVRFVKYAFLTQRGAHLLHVASPGGAGRNRTLGQAELKNLRIIVPRSEEQTAIANAIEAIEDLIQAQVSKFDILKSHKQGLLQQLFPSLEGNEQ